MYNKLYLIAYHTNNIIIDSINNIKLHILQMKINVYTYFIQ